MNAFEKNVSMYTTQQWQLLRFPKKV